MAKDEINQFADLVRMALVNEEEAVRTLWRPVEQEFRREGPDAAKRHLEAEQQELEERIQSLLDQVEEG